MSEGQHAGPDAGTIARLGSQRTHYKQLSRQTSKELGEAREQLKQLSTELEGLKKGDPSGRVKELESELRTLRHRQTFDRLARERGASDEVLDDLFDVLKYRADADEPDEAKIGKLLDDAKGHKSRSRFFAEWDGDDDGEGEGEGEGGDAPAARAKAADRQPADAGRGGRHRPEGTFTLTRAQLADPKFMLDPKNRERIAGAKIRD